MALCVLPVAPVPGWAAVPQQRSAVPSSVRGVVLEYETGNPLANVAVALSRWSDAEGGPRVRESDARGRFLFDEVPPGRYVLTVARIGFTTSEDTLTVASDSEIRIGVELSPSPVPLEAVVVVVNRSAAMAGFESRRRRGRGTYITREEIEEMNPTLVTELLRVVPGASFAQRRFGGLELRLRGGCRPTVWVNGARAISASAQEIGIDQILSPFEVEAIEVYRGAGAVPAQFGPETCGAVVVWTRRPTFEGVPALDRKRGFIAAGIALGLLAWAMF